MKLKSVVLGPILVLLVLGCGSQRSVRSNTVLLLLRDRESTEEAVFLFEEEVVMKTTLEEAGYEVKIATDSGRPVTRDFETTTKSVNMADMKVADYVGFIIPSLSEIAPISAEAISVVERAMVKGKPVAAQRWGVLVLAEAGALKGKRYAFPNDPKGSQHEIAFADATYTELAAGEYVVQDGNIITSPL